MRFFLHGLDKRMRFQNSTQRFQQPLLHQMQYTLGTSPRNVVSHDEALTLEWLTHFETAVSLAIPRLSVSTYMGVTAVTVFFKSFHSRTTMLA